MKLTDSSWFTWKPGGDADSTTFSIRLPNKYDPIAEILGLTKAANEADANGIPVSTNEACAAGYLIKLRIGYRTTNGNRSTDIVCNPKNVSDAMKNLGGKEYGTGNKIVKAKGRPKMDYR